MLHIEPVSLWDHSAEEPSFDAPLTEDMSVDVAVIGGGFTGLSTALHAAEVGMRVHVLEAETIGFGGSGRNVGLVNAGLWLPPQDVRTTLGETIGTRLIDLLGDAPSAVFNLIERHQIRCEAVRAGTIHVAHSKAGFQDLARRASEWQRLGAPVELLDRAAVAQRTGSPQYHGGLLDRRAGTINPMGYVRGLARAARAAGATISTGSPAQQLSQRGSLWAVETPGGTVTAPAVVLATNAYTGTIWPGLSKSFVPIHYCQLATEPLGARAAAILPEGQGIWDTGKIMVSLRRDRDNRLLLGTMGTIVGGEGGLSHRWAARRLQRLFPDLGPVRFETAWHGQIAMTPDHIPRIHRLAEGLYTPIGYNGRGIGPGTVFGKAMAQYLASGDEADLPLPFAELQALQSAPLLARFYQAAFSAQQFWKSL